MKKLWVGIDIAKETLEVALSDGRDRQLGRGMEFANTPDGFAALKGFVENCRNGAGVIHAISEATGVYGFRMVEYLLDNTDWLVSVINPYQIRQFRGAKLVRTKTDKVDAFTLSQYGLFFNPYPYIRPDPVIKELEGLLAALFSVQKIMNQEKRQAETYALRPHLSPVLLELKGRRIAEAEADANRLYKRAVRLVKANPEWARHLKLLCTIPGIGERTAVFLLPQLITLSPAMPECRKLVAYAGLVPEEKQSGTSVHGRVRMSKKGNKWVRRALYMSTLTATRFNPIIKILYERNLAAGQPKMKAVVSCMPRMLRLVWGVFRHQKPFDAKAWAGNADIKDKTQKGL